MSKVFPNAIRTFPPHTDGRDFVLASDVNEIQDELTGVEATLGTKPQVYTNATGKKTEYKDLATRLDAMQRYDEQVAKTVNKLIDADEAGWNLPLASSRTSGTTIPPTKHNLDIATTDWHSITWNIPITDPLDLIKNGPTITCPRTGWWIITCRVISTIPSGPSSLDHMCFTRMYVGEETDVAVSGSTNPRGTRGYHRSDLTYGGEWYQGEPLRIQVRHADSLRVNNRAKHPNPVGNITTWGWLGLTYIRALPHGVIKRPIQDLDPAAIL
ncbi:hypothetical protein [Streptomyces sp. NPDC091027]|uniref:hypothetical protein n=1 Tax=Streptomyces sp. NPDC091027 TaxID=3365971 RepID=UPI0038030807